MTLCEIEKQITELQSGFEGISDPSSLELLIKLLALLESCYWIASMHSQTIQQLKNEINRLKGEQGKPYTQRELGSVFWNKKQKVFL